MKDEGYFKTYSQMTDKEKKLLVDVFYQRPLVKAEKANSYRYHFDKNGIPDYAE